MPYSLQISPMALKGSMAVVPVVPIVATTQQGIYPLFLSDIIASSVFQDPLKSPL